MTGTSEVSDLLAGVTRFAARRVGSTASAAAVFGGGEGPGLVEPGGEFVHREFDQGGDRGVEQVGYERAGPAEVRRRRDKKSLKTRCISR